MHFHRLIRTRNNSDLYAVLDDRAQNVALLYKWWSTDSKHGLTVLGKYPYTDFTDRPRALRVATDHGKGMAR